jgi:hypothetical protein
VDDERSPQCTIQLLNEEIQQLELKLHRLMAEKLRTGSTGDALDSSSVCEMQAIDEASTVDKLPRMFSRTGEMPIQRNLREMVIIPDNISE